jgi:hypothetical protein
MNDYIVVFKQKTGLIVNKHYVIVSKQNYFISIQTGLLLLFLRKGDL